MLFPSNLGGPGHPDWLGKHTAGFRQNPAVGFLGPLGHRGGLPVVRSAPMATLVDPAEILDRLFDGIPGDSCEVFVLFWGPLMAPGSLETVTQIDSSI